MLLCISLLFLPLAEVVRDHIGSEHGNEGHKVEPERDQQHSHDFVEDIQNLVAEGPVIETDVDMGWQHTRVLALLHLINQIILHLFFDFSFQALFFCRFHLLLLAFSVFDIYYLLCLVCEQGFLS